jgi:hypothetical protein
MFPLVLGFLCLTSLVTRPMTLRFIIDFLVFLASGWHRLPCFAFPFCSGCVFLYYGHHLQECVGFRSLCIALSLPIFLLSSLFCLSICISLCLFFFLFLSPSLFPSLLMCACVWLSLHVRRQLNKNVGTIGGQKTMGVQHQGSGCISS